MHIIGEQYDYLCWTTSFHEYNQLLDAGITYINSIAQELAKALKKLHKD